MELDRGDARRLFSTSEPVSLVLPTSGGSSSETEDVAALRALIGREIAEFAVEFGARVKLSDHEMDNAPRVLVGPARHNPAFLRLDIDPEPEPAVAFDRGRQTLIVDAPDVGGVIESLSLLRTLTSTGASRVTSSDCENLEECIGRIEREVRSTYPSFELRGLDWGEICRRRVNEVRTADDPFPALQRWIAELQDMHTWVQPSPPNGFLPYIVHASPDRAVFMRVPEWTDAFRAGVRAGDELIDVDSTGWFERTGAPAHMRPFLTGRRLISGPVDSERTFRVAQPSGKTFEFRESPTFTPWRSPVEWRRLESGSAYLKLSGFPPGTNDQVDDAFAALSDCSRLIVDLRGNSGGSLIEALDVRDRFVLERSLMGWIRFSTPDGSLSEPHELRAEPSTTRTPWPGSVCFLTDAMTASASEDLLLGLKGMPHVKLAGGRTAGGSGRARSIRLLPGMRLSVSSALTYDRKWNCVEGSGITPDWEIDVFAGDNDQTLITSADQALRDS